MAKQQRTKGGSGVWCWPRSSAICAPKPGGLCRISSCFDAHDTWEAYMECDACTGRRLRALATTCALEAA